jgi:hypothetical protein
VSIYTLPDGGYYRARTLLLMSYRIMNA